MPVPAKSLCMSVRKMPSFPVLGARALVRAALWGMCQGCQPLPTSDVPGTVGSLPSVESLRRKTAALAHGCEAGGRPGSVATAHKG